MHGHYAHTELILAGLWGGVRESLPDIEPLIKDFLGKQTTNRSVDQQFLQQYLWPFIKQSHFNTYSICNTRHFPKFGSFPVELDNQWHVGANVFD